LILLVLLLPQITSKIKRDYYPTVKTPGKRLPARRVAANIAKLPGLRL